MEWLRNFDVYLLNKLCLCWVLSRNTNNLLWSCWKCERVYYVACTLQRRLTSHLLLAADTYTNSTACDPMIKYTAQLVDQNQIVRAFANGRAQTSKTLSSIMEFQLSRRRRRPLIQIVSFFCFHYYSFWICSPIWHSSLCELLAPSPRFTIACVCVFASSVWPRKRLYLYVWVVTASFTETCI